MKKLVLFFLLAALSLGIMSGCSKPSKDEAYNIVATTYPVYIFTSRVTAGAEGVNVKLLVEQDISCLHDYTLTVADMKKIDSADVLVASGAGFEAFLKDVTASYAQLRIVDASAGVELLESACSDESHSGHEHAEDAHIWLDPHRAAMQTANIAKELSLLLPQHESLFMENADSYVGTLEDVAAEFSRELEGLSDRNIITFHDGFTYLADSLDLTILRAIEEESGSEASAAEIKEICELIDKYALRAIFTEKNGSDSTAGAIANETGVKVFRLDMIMSGDMSLGQTDGYLEGMRNNVSVLKEALSQ